MNPNPSIIYLNNLFAAICKDIGVNFVFGTETNLYSSNLFTRNSENLTAQSAPTFPRAIWLSPTNCDYTGDISTYRVKIRFTKPESLFVKEGTFTPAEKHDAMERYAKQLFNILLGSNLGTQRKVWLESKKAEIRSESWEDKNRQGQSQKWWESTVNFSINVKDDCLTRPTVTGTSTVNALYNPLATTYKDLLYLDKDLTNPKHY